MPNASKTLQQKALSIHIFADGFSFCSPDQIDYITTPNGTEDFKPAFEEFFAYHKEKSFGELKIINFQHASTFVPTALFDENNKARYLNLFQSSIPISQIEFEKLEPDQLVNVFPVSTLLYSIINNTGLPFSLSHYNTHLFKWIQDYRIDHPNEKELFIHLQKDVLDVFLFLNDTFVFSNRFTVKNTDEFLYYVFFIAEQFDLKSDEFKMIFLGHFKPFQNYYDAAKNYHSTLIFSDVKPLKENFQNLHPAPFFISLFS